jgi:hypothetical protein
MKKVKKIKVVIIYLQLLSLFYQEKMPGQGPIMRYGYIKTQQHWETQHWLFYQNRRNAHQIVFILAEQLPEE